MKPSSVPLVQRVQIARLQSSHAPVASTPAWFTQYAVAPSAAGDIKGPARQLRDPAIFEENGRTFLFYSFCGEQGIAAAELTFQQ